MQPNSILKAYAKNDLSYDPTSIATLDTKVNLPLKPHNARLLTNSQDDHELICNSLNRTHNPHSRHYLLLSP